jgi:hypothetical protein
MVSQTIRDILLETGGTWIQEIYRQLNERLPTRKNRSYLSVVRLINALVMIGLIEFVRDEPGRTELISRHIYQVKPGYENDPRWEYYPMHILYPATKLGRQYKERKLRGLPIESGRAPEYL